MLIPDIEIVYRLLLAGLLGALVGIERERQNQPAGLRTHTILAIGSALAMTLSINIAMQFQPYVPNGDPGRLAAQVISGIGFLGAGAILRYGTNIKGLTTATSLWTIAIVGLAVGAGHYFSASATTALLLIILVILNFVEKRFIRSQTTIAVSVEANDHDGLMNDLRQVIGENRILSIAVNKDLVHNHLGVNLVIKTRENESIERLLSTLSKVQGINTVRIS